MTKRPVRTPFDILAAVSRGLDIKRQEDMNEIVQRLQLVNDLEAGGIIKVLPVSTARRRAGRPATAEPYYENLLTLAAAVILKRPRATVKTFVAVALKAFPDKTASTLERDVFRALKSVLPRHLSRWRDFRAAMLRPVNDCAPAD